MADDTSTPVPTTTPEVNPVAGVTYPWAANDQVVGSASEAFQNVQQAFQQQLLNLMAGQANTTESLRSNYNAFNMMNMAVISQQMNGTDPLLAANSLAYNGTINQPRNGIPLVGIAHPAPAPGTPVAS